MNKRIILIITAVAAVMLIPLVVWIVTSVSQRGTVSVDVMVVPSDAKVKINDTDYSKKGSVNLKPGTYKVAVSKDGFETNTQDVVVQEERDNVVIATLLPISEDAKRWQQNNLDAYLTLEGKAGQIAAQQGQDFIDAYPITKWLPLQKTTYVIGYKQVSDNSNQGIVLTIDATEGFRESALQELRDKGYNPGDYTIEFTNYRNPFNE